LIRQVCSQGRAAHPKRAALHVEGLEERLALATAVPSLPVPLTTPALTAPPVVHTDGTGGPTLADPDRPVHGYKWRRPRPWSYALAGSGQSGAEQSPALVVVPDTLSQPAASSHLLVGGQDGTTATVSGGHLVVRPPEGPLPIDIVFAHL
jgi:hypothetical protein